MERSSTFRFRCVFEKANNGGREGRREGGRYLEDNFSGVDTASSSPSFSSALATSTTNFLISADVSVCVVHLEMTRDCCTN